MTKLTYPLAGGFINHWLVAGPVAVPIEDLERFPKDDFKPQIARHYHSPFSPLRQTPAEQMNLQIKHDLLGEHTLPWRAIHTGDDHFVDLSTFYHNCHFLCAWAYAEVALKDEQYGKIILTTNAPADVWVNGDHALYARNFNHQIPGRKLFGNSLLKGRNTFFVSFEAVALRECPYVMALQISNLKVKNRATVHLPSAIIPLHRRQQLEELLRLATLDKDSYHGEDEIIVKWPEETPFGAEITLRLQTPDGRIYNEKRASVKAGSVISLGKANLRPDGEYRLVLMPDVEEYYLHGMRIQHQLPLRISNTAFYETPAGTLEQRRQEALIDAARRELNIYSEIAKMALGHWGQVKLSVFSEMIAKIDSRADCSDFYLVGLLGVLIRYGDDPAFPAPLKAQIETCALNFKYWMDEPGNDAMCFWSENHQILFHACEVLAGQLFPDKHFSNVNQTGEWHRLKGEQWALGWLRKRAAGGFREWDSNVYFEHDVLALTHLTDLAQNDELAEMAAVILDKLFYTMAVNSFRGVFGSTHGRSYTPYLKGGRQELTSGMGRLLWGMGCFNDHILGSVVLACSNYELPPIIAQIASTPLEELWSREQHAGVMEQRCDLADGVWQVNKVTYKTPDFMLCSAQDYNPGQPGYQQHIWQATFGSDAVVFTSHPPCVSQEGSHRPNFWHGNATLPRVAQWKDLLIAFYQLPADDWMGFTHAYFPMAEFDQSELRDGWAFARKGDGYLALTAAQGIELITSGDNAYRELRSVGSNNVWLCQLGRATRDGSFANFQAKVLGLPITFGDLAVEIQSLRGETIQFSWTGDLRVNDEPQPLRDFKHYDSPISTCELNARQMEIQFFGQALRLDFE